MKRLWLKFLNWLIPDDEYRFHEYQRGPVTGSTQDDTRYDDGVPENEGTWR